MSDTHLRHQVCDGIPVPEADILIHAGDACLKGTQTEVRDFFAWFGSLKATHKVFVAGNHDWLFQKNALTARGLVPSGVTYLQDSSVTIDGVTIYGSPWQPEFLNWAFNLPRGHRLREKWRMIPTGVDILVTHGPPLRILDQNYDGDHVGCGDLRKEVAERVHPRLHVFGHIHQSYGTLVQDQTQYVNASVCDEAYSPFNEPILLEMEAGSRSLPRVLHSGSSQKPMSPNLRRPW